MVFEVIGWIWMSILEVMGWIWRVWEVHGLDLEVLEVMSS